MERCFDGGRVRIKDKRGKRFHRLDVAAVHGPDGGLELRDHGFACAAALAEVALEAPRQANRLIRLQKDRQAHLLAHAPVPESKQSFDDDEGSGLDAVELARARVFDERIARLLDGNALGEAPKVAGEELEVHGRGLVEIERRTLLAREMAAVEIIRVLLHQRRASRVALGQPARERRLARARSTRNPYEKRLWHVIDRKSTR